MKNISFFTIFVLFVAIFTATEAQGQFLSAAQAADASVSSFNDKKMGGQAYQEQVKRMILRDKVLEEHVNRLAGKALDVLDWKFDEYTIGVTRDRSINAFALPGGYAFVNLGMIQEVVAHGSEAQLIGVLAHELEHTNERHAIKRLPAVYAATGVITGMEIAQRYDRRNRSLQIAKTSTIVGAAIGLSALSRHDEWASDIAAHKVLLATGYSVESFASFWDRMEMLGPRSNPVDGAIGSLFASHPSSKARAARAREAGAGQTGAMESSPEWETLKAYVLKKYPPPRERVVR